jgi:hypothetical protein
VHNNGSRPDRRAFAVYLVNRNRAEVLYEQIRIDPVVGKISYLRSVHPQPILLTVPLLPFAAAGSRMNVQLEFSENP